MTTRPSVHAPFDLKRFEQLLRALDLEQIRAVLDHAKIEQARRLCGIKPVRLKP